MRLVGARCLALFFFATFASSALASDTPRTPDPEWVQVFNPGTEPYRVHLERGQYQLWYSGTLYYDDVIPIWLWRDGKRVQVPYIVYPTGGTVNASETANPRAYPMPDRGVGEPYIEFGHEKHPIPGTTRWTVTIEQPGAAEVGLNVTNQPFWKGSGSIEIHVLRVDAPSTAGPATQEMIQVINAVTKSRRIHLEPGEYHMWYTGTMYYNQVPPIKVYRDGKQVRMPFIVDKDGGSVRVSECSRPQDFPMPDLGVGDPYFKIVGYDSTWAIPGTHKAGVTVARPCQAEFRLNITDEPFWKGSGSIEIHVLRVDAPSTTPGATAPVVEPPRRSPSRPSFFSLLFALCLFAFVLLGLVRQFAERQVVGILLLLLVGALAFEFTLRPALANHRPLLELRSIGPLEGWALIRYVIAALALILATGFYVIPVIRRASRSSTTVGWYAAVLVALLFLGQVRGIVFASTRVDMFPSAVIYTFYAWLLLITASAFFVAVRRPLLLWWILKALVVIPIMLYETIASRRRGSAVPVRERVLAMSRKNPEDRFDLIPLVDGQPPVAKNPITHILHKRQMKRERETVEEATKNAQAIAQAIRARTEVRKQLNDNALEGGRSDHVEPRLRAEESEYHATAAENEARIAEADKRRAQARTEIPTRDRPTPGDHLAKRMEKLERDYEQKQRGTADSEALQAWVNKRWGADIDLLRARGDEVGAQRLEQHLQHILDDIATGEV